MKFTSCGKCDDGFIKVKTENGIVLQECECHKKFVEENRVVTTYKHNGFDMRHFNYSPRQYVGTKSVEDKNRLINYVNQFEKNPVVRTLIVYLYGPNGTQKTTFASWIAKSLIKKGFSVRYILMNDLIKLLMKAEDFNEEIAEKASSLVEKFEETDLIIVDESFDKDKLKLWKSGFQLSYIDSWIRRRVGALNKGIFFISNVELNKIESNGMSHSIQDIVQREVNINNTYLQFYDNYYQLSTKEFDGKLF